MIVHHFCDGVYAKETHIPNGETFEQHSHPYDHLSALMKGAVIVVVDGEPEYHEAPCILTIKAGKMHAVSALSDVVWACIHKTDETDPDKVDHAILKG